MTTGSNQRKPPSRIGRWFSRAPRYLYSAGLGWVLGSRFVLLEHTGRNSGKPRSTVLEVIRRGDDSLDVAAAWGTRSDWYRNIRKQPAVLISTGRLKHQEAVASVVAPDEAVAVFAGYATAHPKAAKALAKAFDLPLDTPQIMAETVPIVRFTLGVATSSE